MVDDAYMRRLTNHHCSDNGLSPGRRQAIIWTNAGILLIGPLGSNFSEILIEILTFSFKKIHLNMSSAKWRPYCLGLNVLTNVKIYRMIYGFHEWWCFGYSWGSPKFSKWHIHTSRNHWRITSRVIKKSLCTASHISFLFLHISYFFISIP